MLDETTEYRYDGKVFESREAMQAYLSERLGPSSGLVAKAQRRERLIRYAFFCVAGLLAVSCISNLTSTKAPETTAPTTPPGVSDQSKLTLATMINLHGELCATVTTVSHIRGDLYQVDCTRYRDGTGTASFEVNAATGAVK